MSLRAGVDVGGTFTDVVLLDDRESAGSVPGPACYGRGGTRPTITDADVVLGRLGAELGGRRLHPEAGARRAGVREDDR